MQANPRTLDALFNSQLRYVVPMFQRLYAWQEKPQWETLWEDIIEKADLQIKGISTNPHYLGALIIEGVRPNSPRMRNASYNVHLCCMSAVLAPYLHAILRKASICRYPKPRRLSRADGSAKSAELRNWGLDPRY